MVEVPLPVPVPMRPLNTVRPVARPVRIVWRPVEVDLLRAGYHLQVSTSASFLKFGMWDTTLVHLSDTAVVVRGLAAGQKYYWRVRTAALGLYSMFSPISSFTTSTTATGHAVFLLSPADGSTTRADRVRLSWTRPDSEAVRFLLEFSTDSTFTKKDVDSTIADSGAVITRLSANKIYYWHVAASFGRGWGDFSETFTFKTSLTGIASVDGLPTTYALEQNYPNPFNPATRVRWQVPESGKVRLVVYDMLGREVAVLVDERREAGRYEVTWDGSHLASGVYFYRMNAGTFTQCQKMLLLK